MKIKADEEGKRVLEQLADIALKSGGVQSLNAVNEFLSSIEDLEE